MRRATALSTIPIACLAVLLSCRGEPTTPVSKPNRKYYAMPGEAEWGC